MTVAILDTAILAVDEQFRLLVAADFACGGDGILLVTEVTRCSFGIVPLDAPSLVVPNDVVRIFRGHLAPLVR